MSTVPSLLPPNRTPLEEVVEQTVAAALPTVDLRTLNNARTAPAAFLPHLGWAHSGDQWDPAWPAHTQRAVTLHAPAQHRLKGTPAAVQSALADLGHGDAVIEDRLHQWHLDGAVTLDGSHTLGAGWGRYRVRLTRPVTVYEAALIRRRLHSHQRLAMRLVSLDFTTAAWRLDGEITLDGDYALGEA